MRHLRLAIVPVALGLALGAVATAQQRVEKSNMDLVGYDDLQARSAYQPVIQKQGERWIAYVGHHGGAKLNPLTGKEEANGTSIVDVTNPKQPKYLAHIPGSSAGGGEAGGAQMARICNGSDNPRAADKSKVYLLRSFGTSAHETWDVTDPAKPNRLAVVVSGLRDTHKNWWECDTGIAYLVGGDPAWNTVRMLKIYDLSDPAKPVFIRDFGLPGQQPGAANPPKMTGHFQDIHGPVSTGPAGNRIYIGYGYNGNAILQIVDRSKLLNGPKEPTEANLLYPQVARLDLRPEDGAHTVLPLLGVPVAALATRRHPSSPSAVAATVEHGAHDASAPAPAPGTRNYVAVIGEESGGLCSGERQMTRIVDITTESRPGAISHWAVPDTEELCNRGGRFGPHASNENLTPIYHNRVMFVSYFAGGVRAVDIRDPFNPKEIAYFIPAATSNTSKQCTGRGADQRCKIAIQTNNVEVDDRGYIYTADRADTGMHILELTGPARRVAKF